MSDALFMSLPQVSPPLLTPTDRDPRVPYLLMGGGQCSRLKPSYKFHFEGLSISGLQLKGWFKSKMFIEEYKNEIQDSC
jgi:hypothetical protein